MIPDTSPIQIALFFLDTFLAIGGLSLGFMISGFFLKDRQIFYIGFFGVVFFSGLHLNMTHIYHHLTGTLP